MQIESPRNQPVATVFNPFRRKPDPVPVVVNQTREAPDVETRDAPPSDPFAWALGLLGSPGIAGPEVSPMSSLECAPVRAAVELISGILGTLPVHLYRRTPNGGSEIVSDHPSVALAEVSANPWTSSSELKSALVTDALLYGCGYAFVVKDGAGVPVEIHRLLPTSVICQLDPTTSEPSFRITTVNGTNGANEAVDWRTLIYVRPVVKTDVLSNGGFQTGLAPIKTGRNTISLALALENYASQVLRNGGRPSGIISIPGKPAATALAAMKNAWIAATSGRASGSTAVLTDDAKFQPLAFSSVDQQYQEMRDFTVIEVSRPVWSPAALPRRPRSRYVVQL